MLRTKLGQFNDFVRSIKLRLVIFLFDHHPVIKPQPKKILILRHDGKIGDSLVSSFLTYEIERLFPDVQTAVVIAQNNEWTLKYFSNFKKVFISRKGIVASLLLGLKIRRWRPDVVLNFAHDLKPKTAFLLCFSKARVVGLSRQVLRAQDQIPSIDRARDHFAQQIVHCFDLAGFESSNVKTRSRIQLSVDEENQARHLMSGWNQKKFLCLNLKASASLKGLTLEAAERILKLVSENLPDWEICLLGQADEKGSMEKKFSGKNKIHILAGKPFGVQMAIVKSAGLVITPDTSWVHIASAFNVPLLVIYRQEKPNGDEFPSQVWAGRSEMTQAVFANGKSTYRDEIDASTFSDQDLAISLRELIKN